MGDCIEGVLRTEGKLLHLDANLGRRVAVLERHFGYGVL